jgi:hypothetical protein
MAQEFLPAKGTEGQNPDNWKSLVWQKKAPDRQEKALNSQFALFFYI